MPFTLVATDNGPLTKYKTRRVAVSPRGPAVSSLQLELPESCTYINDSSPLQALRLRHC
jgi:hypothetical protein